MEDYYTLKYFHKYYFLRSSIRIRQLNLSVRNMKSISHLPSILSPNNNM